MKRTPTTFHFPSVITVQLITITSFLFSLMTTVTGRIFMYCNKQTAGQLAQSIDGFEFDSRHRKMAAGLMSALMIDSVAAQVGEVEFNIISQPASSALISFAEQANISVVVKHNARDVQVGALRGRYSIQNALDLILKDTGLVYKFRDNAVVVKRSVFGGGRKSLFSVISAAVLSLVSPDMVYAQYDTTDEKSDSGLVLEEVTVTGIRSSIKQALDMKREDSRVIDGISAKDIADFPDQNLAESIQRVTGVQLLRDPNTGRGSLISLRGLGPSYARTTLNGQTLAKPDLASGFTFDFVQPEIASSVEVVKSPSADMDEGGLSGTININTINPLDYEQRKVVLSGQTIYSEATEEYTPKINVAYIDQFMDGKLGAMANVGYHEIKSQYDIFFTQSHQEFDVNKDDERPDLTAEGEPITFPSRHRYRRTARDAERVLFNGALQYLINDELATKLSLTYVEEAVIEDQQQLLSFFDQHNTTALNISNAYVDHFTSIENRAEINWSRYDREKDTGALTWETNWVRDDWEVDAVVHHTSSTMEFDYMGVQYTSQRIVETTSDFRSRSNPTVTHSVDLNDPSFWELDNVGGRHFGFGVYNYQEATENAFQLDVKRFIDVIPLVSAVKVGAKYRMQTLERENHNNLGLSNDLDPTSPIPSVAEAPYYIKDFANGEIDGMVTDWVMPDIDAYASRYFGAGRSINNIPRPQDFYQFDRDILSVYAMAELEGEHFRGNIGVRYVYTDKEFLVNEQSRDFVPDPENPDTIVSVSDEVPTRFTEGNDYSEVLPSANIVFDITDEIIFRAAAAKVMVRPEAALGQRTYGTRIQFDEDRIGTNQHRFRVDEGPTDLKPLTANQFDVSFEWYYDDASAVSVGYFYKKVKNDLVREQYCPESYGGIIDGLVNTGGECVDAGGSQWEIKRDFNREGIVEINGGELGITHMFSNLPGAWSGLGVQANYSYLDVRVGSDDGKSLDIAPETANLIAFYEWGGFGMRLAYNYRDAYRQESFFGNRVISPKKQLDLSISYQFTDQFSMGLEGINVTNDSERGHLLDKDNGSFQGIGVGGATYQLALKYQL